MTTSASGVTPSPIQGHFILDEKKNSSLYNRVMKVISDVFGLNFYQPATRFQITGIDGLKGTLPSVSDLNASSGEKGMMVYNTAAKMNEVVFFNFSSFNTRMTYYEKVHYGYEKYRAFPVEPSDVLKSAGDAKESADGLVRHVTDYVTLLSANKAFCNPNLNIGLKKKSEKVSPPAPEAAKPKKKESERVSPPPAPKAANPKNIDRIVRLKKSLVRELGPFDDNEKSLNGVFKKWAVKNHPDKVSQDSESKKNAHEKFTKVQKRKDKLLASILIR